MINKANIVRLLEFSYCGISDNLKNFQGSLLMYPQVFPTLTLASYWSNGAIAYVKTTICCGNLRILLKFDVEVAKTRVISAGVAVSRTLSS